MATLNLSSEGNSITKSYQTVVDTPLPSGSSASSPTYAQWAIFSVSAPLASAFQQDSGKESVLRVQGSADGELEDLVEEFSDGKIQFAFVKVKDPNTTLPKYVLIAWCGEGVPERTKGYFTSHLAAVAKLLHGYHLQVTARTDSDLTPENIIRKVADASGSRYSGDTSLSTSAQPPPVASKPVFTPTQVGGGSTGFNPLGSRSRAPVQPQNVDSDGWGADAPPVTRSELERVAPAYQPTKVDMAELTSQKPQPSQVLPKADPTNGQGDVVKGEYQPIGKVDIAAIRRQAQESGSTQDDRPTIVKGAYEPVGKVDIAAIRARAQPSGAAPPISPPATESEEPKPVAERSAAFSSPERLTSLPKPKVANKFGAGTSSFTGTKAPAPAGLGATPGAPAAPQIGLASKTFADEGGKTPAQIWAEKKARERGNSGAAETAKPVAAQTSGGGAWESGYVGKKWAPVQTTRTGQSAGDVSENRTGEEPVEEEPVANVSAMRDKFKGAAPMGAPTTTSRPSYGEPQDDAPPPMDLSSKPNAARGVPIPGIVPAQEEEEEERPPVQPPRSPTPPSPPAPSSPIRIAQPVGRGQDTDIEPPEEEDRFSPPPLPAQPVEPTPAARPIPPEPQPAAPAAGKRAVAQFDYEKAEDNEIDLRENEVITDIDQVDEDWWLATNSKGERGLFPANYVELIDGDDDDDDAAAAAAAPPPAPMPAAVATPAAQAGKTATALYDYDAAEDNEISFVEGAKITNVTFPDDDWWLGVVDGKEGLFPGVYVQLDD